MIVVFGYSQAGDFPKELEKSYREFTRKIDSLSRLNLSVTTFAREIDPPPTICNDANVMPWFVPKYTLLSPMFVPYEGATENVIIKYPLKGSVGIGTCFPYGKLTVANKDGWHYSFLVQDLQGKTDFSITKEGRVGINTDQPVADLDIRNVPGQNYTSFHMKQDKNDLWIGMDPTLSMFYSTRPLAINWTGEPVYFGFLNNGKVMIDGVLGVGTITPQARLHVNGGDFKLSGGHAYIDQGNLTLLQGNAFINKGNLNIGQGDAWINQGKLGIGVNPANQGGYRLAVCGKVICKGIRVQKNVVWCDYVFEKDYKLMPLEDLQEYVQKNKHLPDIPTTSQVQEEGIELAEMNALLLKKIEELTLYIFELKKEIEELKNSASN